MATKQLTRGATVYQLDGADRDAMKRLTDAGLVVSVGQHARLKAINAELLAALESVLANYQDGYILGHRTVIKEVRAALNKAKGEA